MEVFIIEIFEDDISLTAMYSNCLFNHNWVLLEQTNTMETFPYIKLVGQNTKKNIYLLILTSIQYYGIHKAMETKV